LALRIRERPALLPFGGWGRGAETRPAR